MDDRINAMKILRDLSQEWHRAKADEKAAQARRIAAEKSITDITELPEEGTAIILDSLRVKTGYTRKWDQTQLLVIEEEILPAFFPFRTELKEDRMHSRKIEMQHPDLWGIISEALTLVPAKPSFADARKADDSTDQE